MASNDLIEMDGVIDEVLAGSNFRVRVRNIDGSEHLVMCYLSGKVRQNNIRITLGDAVRIAVSPYSADKGRIVFRYK